MSYPNDNFADATVLTGDSGSVTPFHYDGISDPASSEPGETIIGAGETLWWVWTVPFTGRAFVTTRYSPADGGGGLDTKIQAFLDFTSSLGSNDDDRDAPTGSYRANSYLELDVATGDTIYIQVDQYDTGQAGMLNLSWGQATPDPTLPSVGSWVTDAATSLEEEVRDTLDVTGDRYNDTHRFLADGGTWADTAEGIGEGGGIWHTPPKRPTYAVFAQVGEYNTGDWTDAGVPAPDAYAIELNPFALNWTDRVTALQLPAPTLPSGAIGWEYLGFPIDSYGTSYQPQVDPGWVTASSIRAVLEVNKVALPTGTYEQTADTGWTWITPPVAGIAGPQHISFRYDGPGVFTDSPFVRFDLYWNGVGFLATSITASTIVDDIYAIFETTVELGPDETLTGIDAGYVEGNPEHVHWSAPYTGGWTDYLMTQVPAEGDIPEFNPEPLTLQMRLLTTDGSSKFRSGTTLAASPLLFEQTTAGTVNETIDTDWLDLDPASGIPDGLYLNYAEQISHTSPEPDPLPARLPRHHHMSTADYVTGPTAIYGSTVAFERPDSTGSYERLLLRLTYQAPRHRFIYPGTPTTLVLPPLRQWPRDDGLRRNPGRTTATSRQGSLRRGPRGTYT